MIYDNPSTLICFIPAFYEASGISLSVQHGTSRLRDIAAEYIWAMPQILCIYDACRGSSSPRQNYATYVRSPGENANYINRKFPIPTHVVEERERAARLFVCYVHAPQYCVRFTGSRDTSSEIDK